MNVKQYKLFKTEQKTVRENGLVVKERKRLYDMSLVDEIPELNQMEKDIIKEDLVRYHITWENMDVFTVRTDNFTSYNGYTKWAVHKVFNKDGKQLYFIIQLIGIKLYKQERHSSFEHFGDSTHVGDFITHYTEPGMDIEI